MAKKNGLDYSQNYDVVVKWVADVLKGQNLDVIGVSTGRIVDVFGFEPVDIKVEAGRVDLMVRDDAQRHYHVEEQRNLRRKDMYRFAAHHFAAAKRWGDGVTDIVLASGEVYAGDKRIVTASGEYSPLVVDFSRKDGARRLAEIREAAKKGEFDNWLELVFLPLYGKETGRSRCELVEQVIRFETELYRCELVPARLLAATLIMSNKLIDRQRLEQLWEEIKMLDIIEIAREKGLEEGREEGRKEGLKEGLKEGQYQGMQELLMEALIEKFGLVPPRLSEKIRRIDNGDVLKALFRQVSKCGDLDRFEEFFKRL